MSVGASIRVAKGLQRFSRQRHALKEAGALSREPAADDWLAVEAPLEIRIAGERWLLLMRTPGDDRDLCLGLLLSEGVITSRDDISAIAHCGKPEEESYGNVIEVTPAPLARLNHDVIEASQRRGLLTSACGVCGRQLLDDLLARCTALEESVTLDASIVARLPETLAQRQPNFSRSGGTHAAMLTNCEGEPVSIFEDVGRHNAVDKVLGHWLRQHGSPASRQVLVVSGRASFEILHKAVVSRCAAVVSVSAPSSLAVETAQRFGVILASFARHGAFNVYAGDERIRDC